MEWNSVCYRTYVFETIYVYIILIVKKNNAEK